MNDDEYEYYAGCVISKSKEQDMQRSVTLMKRELEKLEGFIDMACLAHDKPILLNSLRTTQAQLYQQRVLKLDFAKILKRDIEEMQDKLLASASAKLKLKDYSRPFQYINIAEANFEQLKLF